MQAASPPSDDDKKRWRAWLRQQLRSIGDPETSSDSIRRHLKSALEASRPLRIASFSALPGEPDLMPLLTESSAHMWHLPHIDEGNLRFFRIGSASDLQPGAFGIAEPVPGLPEIEIADLDWFLCPGLGFGRDGSRLGRGKGFYDRVLALARPDARKVGIAFEEQIVDRVPKEAHDVAMTDLLSPVGFIATGSE